MSRVTSPVTRDRLAGGRGRRQPLAREDEAEPVDAVGRAGADVGGERDALPVAQRRRP